MSSPIVASEKKRKFSFAMDNPRAARRLTFSGSSPYSLTPTFSSGRKTSIDTLDVRSIKTFKTRGLEGHLDLRLTSESVIENTDSPEAALHRDEIDSSLEISRVIEDILVDNVLLQGDRASIQDEWERQSYDPMTGNAKRALDFEGAYVDSPEMMVELTPTSPAGQHQQQQQQSLRPGGFLIFSGDEESLTPVSLKVRRSPLLIGRNRTQGTINDLLMTEMEIFSVRTDDKGRLRVTSKMTTAAFEINERDAISTGRFTVTYKRPAEHNNAENIGPDEATATRLNVKLPRNAPVGVVSFPESMLPDKVMIERGADLPYVNPLYLVPSGERITVMMPEDKKFFSSDALSLDHFVIHMRQPNGDTLMKLAVHKLVFAQWVFVPRSVISIRSVVLSPSTTVDLLLHITVRRQPLAGLIYVKITQVDVVVPEDFTELRQNRRRHAGFTPRRGHRGNRGFARDSGDWNE
jgi:hypothetical protein